MATYFPAAHAEKEADQVGLLLLLELFDILEGTHFGCAAAAATTMLAFLRNCSSSSIEDEELILLKGREGGRGRTGLRSEIFLPRVS